jgi:hypothetical protein
MSAKVPTLKVKAVATEEERKLQEKYRQLREKKKKVRRGSRCCVPRASWRKQFAHASSFVQLEEAKLAAGGAVEPEAEKATEVRDRDAHGQTQAGRNTLRPSSELSLAVLLIHSPRQRLLDQPRPTQQQGRQ